MIGYIKKIKEISAKLLKDGKVDMVIGFRKGTLPMMNEPCFARNAADVEKLVWDSNCGINLANYLTDRKEKIGVIAKGCDSRNIVVHMTENKIKREQLVIIGVPCKGMIDRRKVAALSDKEIKAVSEDGGKVVVQYADGDQKIDKKDVLQNNCSVCVHRNPVLYDELAADLVEEPKDIDRFQEVKKIEAMSVEERQNYFDDLISTCIRCYACRNACPLCYCPTCFVDESKPQWVGKADNPVDVKTFHLLRAYHCAGRCTDCGSCARACPMGIDVRAFTKKLEKDCLDLWAWEPGMEMDVRPALDTYKPEDPELFIK